VAVAKAASGALLSSGGNAFSTRTASFIVESHFPPGVDFTPGRPAVRGPALEPALRGREAPGLAARDRPAIPEASPSTATACPVGGLGVEGDGVYGSTPIPRARRSRRA
jgi:hypothetical protein